MAYQSGQNVIVSYKTQSGLGVPASGAGGTGLRITPSPGLRLLKSIIESREVRRDGQTTRGRHGSRRAQAQYNHELSLASYDALFEASQRGTFVAALAITQATMTSITTTTSTIVAAAGSWLTQGVRRGDMVQLTGHSTAANNGKWFRVLSVTTLTITLPANSLTLDAAADSSFTLTVAKTVLNGVTERYITIDEYHQDMDVSYKATDMKLCRLELSAQPDSPVTISTQWMGLDMDAIASGATSPVLTTPTFTTSLPFVLADGTIRVSGTDAVDLTGFSFAWDLGGQVPAVLAPNPPDVFLNNGRLTGSISGLRSASTYFNLFDQETQFEIMAHMIEVGDSDPKDFVSVYMGNCVFDGSDLNGVGSDGPIIESLPFRAGIDEGGSDRALTTVKWATSAP